MRVLAHIHTFNDVAIIDRTIEALRRQVVPVSEILVVDNASTDGTLERPSLKDVTVLRHREENLGTSGAIVSGLRFALERHYNWIWILDADTAVHPDALGKLVDLYSSLPPTVQNEVLFLAGLPRDEADGRAHHGGTFGRNGLTLVTPSSDERYYSCQVAIWSGCLYQLAAVRRVGLPNPNYVLDWGEVEYGYRAMKAGYRGFMHMDATVEHNIGRPPSLAPIDVEYGPISVRFYDFPPIRCYYMCRNMLYFALYDLAEGRSAMLGQVVLRVIKLTGNFLVRPRNNGRKILACLLGAWHGVTGNIAARYPW